MRLTSFVLFAYILASSAVPAQIIDSNSITVSVSRSMDVRADTVLFTLAVSSELDSDLTAVTTALTGAGIQGATFVGLTDSSGYVSGLGGSQTHTLIWRFTYSVPYAQMKDTLTKLAAAVSSFNSKGRIGMSLTFSLSGSSVSDAAIADARRKIAASLIDDAKKEAALVADSAGMAVGQILGISDGYVGSAGSTFGGVSISPYFSTTGTFLLSSSGSATPTISVTQSMTVRFAAGR